jgi:hypothetical protein
VSRFRWIGAALGAVALTALAVVLALRGTTAGEDLVELAVLAGLVAVGWQLYRRRSETRREPSADRREELPPERSPDVYPLSGTNLARLLSDAEQATREADDIAAGLAVVRPVLRDTLFAVLVESGLSERAVAGTLASGSWTDEPAAAAVLDERVPLPRLTFRERVVAWLFPERFLRAYVEAAVAEIDAVADRELPTVPGEDAPRPVPVTQPSLARLRQGLDGTPQSVADPFDDAGSGGVAEDITDGRALHERLGVVEPEDES